jgi:hypothetical protein
MDDTYTVVYCTVLFEGIHCWPDCPFEEVKYLRDPHRHIFHIKAYNRVHHDDRDVEFIMLKHRVEEYLHRKFPGGQMGKTSCEMLGRDLMEHFGLIEVEVNEDGENGAVIFKKLGAAAAG